MIQKYSSLFKDVPSCALITTVASFIIYMLLFMGTCYGFTWMPDEESFNKKFERYLILALAVFMIFPFTLSTVFIHFAITFMKIQSTHMKSTEMSLGCKCLRHWLSVFISTTVIFTAAILSAGIYTIIEGTLYVGITVLVTGLILSVFKLHTILIVEGLRQLWMELETPRASTNSNESTRV